MINDKIHYDGESHRMKIIECIRQHIQMYGMAPTIRELRDMTGTGSSSTIMYHTNLMLEDGRLSKPKPKAARGITISGMELLVPSNVMKNTPLSDYPITVQVINGMLLVGNLYPTGISFGDANIRTQDVSPFREMKMLMAFLEINDYSPQRVALISDDPNWRIPAIVLGMGVFDKTRTTEDGVSDGT